AAGHRRDVDVAVSDVACRTLAGDIARTLRSRRHVLDSRGVHADRNAQPGARGARASSPAAAALFCPVPPLGPVRYSRLRFGDADTVADDRQARILGAAWALAKSCCSALPA